MIGNAQLARLALAESLELLDRACDEAMKRYEQARAEVETAKAEWQHWNSRRYLFKQAVRAPETRTGEGQ